MGLEELVDELEQKCYLDNYEEIIEGIKQIVEEISKYQSLNDDMILVLNALLLAMENQDTILIGDCLEYGIKFILNNQTLNKDFFNNVLNGIPDIGEDIFYYASYSDEPVLCVKKDEKAIIRLNSFVSPEFEVEKWFSNVSIKKNTPLVCLFGLGTGLFAEKLLDHMSKDSALIIYEPNKKIIDYCIKCGDSGDVTEKKISERIKKILEDKRTCLVIEEENDLLFRQKLNEYINYMGIKALKVFKHNRYDRLYPKSCINYYRTLSDHIVLKATNRNTMALFKEDSVNNLFKNIYMFDKMTLFNDIEQILPKDIPAIIVSAGPSLEKNVDLLSLVKGHFLIFAVTAAIPFLLERNIVPDLAITLDAQQEDRCFEDERSHFIPCIFDVSAKPSFIKSHKGKTFLINTSNSYFFKLMSSIAKEMSIYPCGGSVATAAFVILRMFGQKKIILTGQDLAFLGDVSHAGGVNDNLGYQKSVVEGYYGGQVTTRSDWLGYLKWFEVAIEDIKEKKEDICVIDATEGGAKIHGAKQMSLKEVIDGCRDINGNLPEYNFEDKVRDVRNCFTEKEFQELLKKHEDAIEKLKEIEKKADEAVYVCKKLIEGIEKGIVSESYIDKQKKTIAKINEWCSKTLIFPIVNDYLISDVIDEIGDLLYADGDNKTRELNGVKLMKISFEAIADASKKIYIKANNIKSEIEHSTSANK